MATIPMGNFGQVVAQPGQAVNVPRQDVSSGLESVASAAQAINTDSSQWQLKLDQERMRSQAALTLAKTTNDMQDAHDEVKRGIEDGSVPIDKAAGELKSKIGKITGTAFDGWGEQQRGAMEVHAEQVQGTLQRSLNGTIQARQQKETAGTIDQMGEQVSRLAMRQGPQWGADTFNTFVDNTKGGAGLTDAQAAKIKQSFSERVHATFYESAGAAARIKGDPEALGGLVTKLQGPDGDPLDPTKRTHLTMELFGWQQMILARQDRAANQAAGEQLRRENAAVDIYNQAFDHAINGRAYSPEFISDMTATAADTKMAQPVAAMIASQRTISGFASRPAAERAAMIEGRRRDSATPGIGTDPAGAKLTDLMITIDGKIRTAIAENPWAAALDRGVIQEAPQFDMANPGEAAQVMAKRMSMIRTVEQWTGKKESPLQPGEAEKIGKMVRTMPPDQAAGMLSDMGAKVGDSDRIAMLGKQLQDKDGVLGLAMLSAGDKTTAGRYNAELILRGAQALADKTVKRDDAALTGWKSEIAGLVNGTLGNPEAEDQIKRAAYYVRAAMDDGSAKAPGFAGIGSADAVSAVAMVVGAPIERQGVKTLLPRGMKEGAFDDALSKYKAPELAALSPTGKLYVGGKEFSAAALAAQLTDTALRRWDGSTYIPMRNGRPVTVDQAGVVPLKIKVQ